MQNVVLAITLTAVRTNLRTMEYQLRNRTYFPKLASIALAASLGLVACGGGEADTPPEDASDASDPADTPAVEPDESAEPAEPDEPESEAPTAPVVEEITYESRGVEVPAIITLPQGGGDHPLVVMMHGHGGSKDENFGFPSIATSLAEQGIASLRMDFPGSGESSEGFEANTLSNMRQDVLAGIDAAVADYPIDPERIGGFGYSMGGRLALELTAAGEFSFTSLALLAPAADTEDLKFLFGGPQDWEELKAQAQESPDGYAEFTTIYGQEQHLSTEWFDDLEAHPGQSVIEAAAGSAPEAVSVIYAVDDEAVSPAVSEATAEGLAAQTVVVPYGGHGYGFYDEEPGPVLDMVTHSVVTFFIAGLTG